MAVDWKLLLDFPAMDRADRAFEIDGDFLPGIETVSG
jgi:hypothetical protein